MKRRRFLKGVAGAALAAPFLPSLHRRARAQNSSATGPQRLVIFYTNNGCLTNRWFPKVENGAIDATALAGTTLAPLADVASKLLFPRGLAMYPKGQVMVNGVTYFDPHDQGMGSKLTCAPIDSAGEHWALSHSLDWEAAKLVNPAGNTSPMVLTVGSSFKNVKGIVSYRAAQDPYQGEANPKNVYTKLSGLFAGGAATTAADWRALKGKSILDLVRGDLDDLGRRDMSMADKKRLSDWKDLLRSTETGVMPTVSAACNADNASKLGLTSAVPTGARDATTAFTRDGDLMRNLIALTMMCDANRVILMQWPGFATFKWDGMNHPADHHGLSHRVGSAAVGGNCVANVLQYIHQIDTWYADRYSKLVHLINSIGEGDRTMLDNSAVMWLPELADGNAHNNNNLPIVIAGSLGGYLKQGVSVNLDPGVRGGALTTGNSEASCADGGTGAVAFNTGSSGGTTPINKLYVTLLNGLGRALPGWQTVTTFGVADSQDLTKITKPGELPELKAS